MKAKLNEFFNKIKRFLLHGQKTKQVLISCGLYFLAFTLFIPIGMLNKSTAIYDSAQYFSQVIRNNDDVNYIAVSAEQKDEDEKMNSTPVEYRALYGAFGMRKINYAGTVNSDKSEKIVINEIDGEDNLSFLYCSVGFSNKEYEGHYMHESYPLELMFYGITSRSGSDYSFIYISQTQANALLKNRKGLEPQDITPEQYESLLGQSVVLTIKGKAYSYTIGDIYYETNYFYDALHETMGSFILGYYFYPEGLKKQATFFMNSYEFQNKTHLNYSLNQYPTSKFNYKIAHYSETQLNMNKALSFVKHQSTAATVFSYILLFVPLGLIVLSFYLSIKHKLTNQPANYIYFGGSCLLAYLFFFLIFAMSKQMFAFPPFSSTVMLFTLLCLVIAYVTHFFLKRKDKNS